MRPTILAPLEPRPADETTSLSIARLVVTDFRCYETARLELDARPVVLAGPNGAGKTNLLEAVSLLAPGRGLRRARIAEIDRRGGSGGWGVAATVQSAAGGVDIGTGREPDGERRIVRINGANARGQTALADFVSVVWLTPEMDRLFREGASARRRFLDRLVFGFDPAHAGRVSAYEHALRERARLLRDSGGDDAWITALEETLAARGVAIAAARLDMVQRLDRALKSARGPFPGVALSVSGEVEDWLGEGPALAAEDRLGDALRASRAADAESGTARVGPHRSDLEARHLAKGMPAAQCSTGEQKAMLVAIVLGEARLQAAERGAAPLLLLDEVAAHLDGEHREALFHELCDLGVQAWLSGTDSETFAALGRRAQHVAVVDAAVSRLS